MEIAGIPAMSSPSSQRGWEEFYAFVLEEGLGSPEALQCEVAYINHIEVGQGWESMEDLSGIFPAWSGLSSKEFLPTPEGVHLRTSFLIPDGQGRLHVQVQPAIRSSDLIQILQVTLTARGAPRKGGTAEILEWFDLGHEWVVRGFVDFTSTKMHELWKRER